MPAQDVFICNSRYITQNVLNILIGTASPTLKLAKESIKH